MEVVVGSAGEIPSVFPPGCSERLESQDPLKILLRPGRTGDAADCAGGENRLQQAAACGGFHEQRTSGSL